MNNISPLGALVALVIVGVSIEAVEQQNQTAAYALVLLILLGMITFNASAFRTQISTVIALLNQKRNVRPVRQQRDDGGGGAKFG